MTTEASTTPATRCPNDEFLAAALTTGVGTDEQQWFDAHLDTCDRCLDAVGAAMRRLRIGNEIPAVVPDAVRRRAAVAASAPAPALLPGPHHPSPSRPLPARPAAGEPATRSRAARGKLAALLRSPMMIPAALAAGAVLAITTQNWMATEPPRSLTRSISVRQQARITANEAAVRRQPSGHAEVIATVTRGTLVDISAEERDWSHVTLPDGTEGWVDQGALR